MMPMSLTALHLSEVSELFVWNRTFGIGEDSSFKANLIAVVPCYEAQVTDTCDGEIHVSAGLAIIVLRSFNDHKMSRKIDSPGQGAGGNKDLEDNHKPN